MQSTRLVVFDLDGTLNRTELYSVPAHQKALAELGITDVSAADILATFGARNQDSIPLLIRSGDPAAAARFQQRVSRLEHELIPGCAACYPGVPELLARLRADGYRTAVCSNASERYIRAVLSALRLDAFIDELQPLVGDYDKSGTLRLLLERVRPAAAVMVGDRAFDWDAARANRLPFIGCRYGFMPAEIAGADVTVRTPLEIADAVARLLPARP